MIIEDVVEFLKAKLESTKYFGKVFGLCELIEKGDQKQPAFYKGNGEYDETMNNWDSFNGIAYFRKIRNVSVSKSDDRLILTSCNTAINFRIPLRLVVVVPKANMTCDNAYADDNFIQSLMGQLILNSTDLKGSIGAIKTEVFTDDYSTDRKVLINEEFGTGKEINYKFIHAYLDFTAKIDIDKKCLKSECDYVYT